MFGCPFWIYTKGRKQLKWQRELEQTTASIFLKNCVVCFEVLYSSFIHYPQVLHPPPLLLFPFLGLDGLACFEDLFSFLLSFGFFWFGIVAPLDFGLSIF